MSWKRSQLCPPSSIWAVGFSTDSNFINKTLTLHWDGNTWSIVPSPSLDSDILFAVDALASNDVWAVGRTKPGGYGEDRTLTMHWDGSAWNIVPSPNDSSNDNDLFGVAAIASDDVWAVGNAGSLKTLAIHWDGASWGVAPIRCSILTLLIRFWSASWHCRVTTFLLRVSILCLSKEVPSIL